MKPTVLIIQIIIGIALSISILLQSKGTGLGAAFGESGREYRSKRGVEKLLFRGTILLIFFFLLSSVINVLVK